jgi:hypothetical protein
MKKNPVMVGVRELESILDQYLEAAPSLNYAIKILGHPGVGKSAVVRQAADRARYLFIDTRLAFKENVDLGGYPVPDHGSKRMIYYRPKFIPPETVPEGYRGVLWFLDEANRAHPTVIQTLFQIITEKTCGEHSLPQQTAIVLAGNLGDADSTTITEFDDSALDGRLAVFQLKPSAPEWLIWAGREGVHPSILRYISAFPERLWDDAMINPNPRGWHQVSQALSLSYRLLDDDALKRHLADNPSDPMTLLIQSLVGNLAGSDFILQVIAPRAITTEEVLAGDNNKLRLLGEGKIPMEDILWAFSGAVARFREIMEQSGEDLGDEAMDRLANTLLFIGSARADMRISFFYLLLRDCGILTQVPAALGRIPDRGRRDEIRSRYEQFLNGNEN